MAKTLKAATLLIGDTDPAHKRPLADLLTDCDSVYNVKSYGALGDGSHDDTDNIQACIYACYGGPGAFGSGLWNGEYGAGGVGKYANKILYFPPGLYIISHELYIQDTLCTVIRGSGKHASVIQNTNTAGDGHGTVLFINDWRQIHMEDLGLIAGGGAKSVCLELTNSAPVSLIITAAYSFLCQNCLFQGGEFGARLGDELNPLGYGVIRTGHEQTSETAWVGCSFVNCVSGIRGMQLNCLNHLMIGCEFIGCTNGIEQSSFPKLLNVSFRNSVLRDVQTLSSITGIVIGCNSNSPSFLAISGSLSPETNIGPFDPQLVIGCYHKCLTAGSHFCDGLTGGARIDSCRSENGNFTSSGSDQSRMTLYFNTIKGFLGSYLAAWPGGVWIYDVNTVPIPKGPPQNWDATVAPHIVLSGSGLIATAQTGVADNDHVRGFHFNLALKIYWEVAVTNKIGASGFSFGLVNTSFHLEPWSYAWGSGTVVNLPADVVGQPNSIPSSDATLRYAANSVAVDASGNIIFNGVVQGNIGVPAMGDVISGAVDLSWFGKRAWFRRNAGSWVGTAVGDPTNPAAGGNGVDISAMLPLGSAYLWPLISFRSGGAGGSLTGRFIPASYTQTVPSGYVTWVYP